MSNDKFYNGDYISISEMPTVSDLIKNGSRVRFSFFRAGMFYYIIVVPNHMYEFPVPIDDIGNATLHDYDKAITFMRWIRKSIEEKTIQEKRILYAEHITERTSERGNPS